MSNELNYLENIILEYLRTRFKFSTKKQDYKILNDKRYVLFPASEIAQKFGLTSYKQRTMLKKFQDMGLLSVKFWCRRTRYFSLDTQSIDIEYLKAEIKLKILKTNNLMKLTYINEVLDNTDEVIHD